MVLAEKVPLPGWVGNTLPAGSPRSSTRFPNQADSSSRVGILGTEKEEEKITNETPLLTFGSTEPIPNPL